MGRVDDVGRGWRSWAAAHGREILDMFASGEGCTDLERPSCSTEMCSLLRDICCSSQRFFSAFLHRLLKIFRVLRACCVCCTIFSALMILNAPPTQRDQVQSVRDGIGTGSREAQ